MRYQWQVGAGAPKNLRDIPVEKAVAELQRIHERDGGIRTQAVVDEARAEDAPLHAAFEWDNDVAAEEHRRSQARQLVRAIVVVPDPEENKPPIRAYFSVTVDDEPRAREYRSVEVITRDEQEQVLRRFRTSVRRLKDQYRDVLEFLGAAEREAFAVLAGEEE